MTLSINMTSASSDALDSRLSHAITAMTVVLAKKERLDELPQGPSLDITFMLPGKLDKPDFEGMRMGSYTEDENILFFERSVPGHLIDSEQAGEFVALVLKDAVANASDYFAEQSRVFNPIAWEKALDLIGIPQCEVRKI